MTAFSLALLLAACGSDPTGSAEGASTTTTPSGDDATTPAADDAGPPLPTAVQELRIDGDEYGFDIDTGGDEALRPGWTAVTFTNIGVEAHQVMFASLKDGVELAQLAEVAGEDSSGSRAIEFVDMLGGVSYIGPGRTVEALVDLPEGVVMAMCYVPDPEGVAHALSGMTTMLEVGPPPEPDPEDPSPEDPSPEPATERVRGTITMGDDGYAMPSALPAGWYRVVNDDAGDRSGQGLHELSILGLEAPLEGNQLSQLLDDLATNAAPDVQLDALGGMGALSAGFEGYLRLDLEPGPYLAVDFMPDPGDPRPHLLDGYATPFTS